MGYMTGLRMAAIRSGDLRPGSGPANCRPKRRTGANAQDERHRQASAELAAVLAKIARGGGNE